MRKVELRVMTDESKTSGRLFVVATPIGNLDDITLRAVNVLKSVATIAAEDTRHTRTLLQHLGIEPPRLISLHEHNETAMTARVLELLAEADVALVSDAGTPLVCDPGFALVRAVWEAGGVVVPIPGPSSVLTVLSASPLPPTDFTFAGFLPSKAAALRKRLEAFAGFPGAVVFFEAPHRIVATLEMLEEVYPARRLLVGRELTKMHETLLVGTACELLPQVRAEHRGEFVLVLEGGDGAGSLAGEAVLKELAGLLPPRQVARITARLAGGDSRSWYERLVSGEADT